jgi:hypothetical protein
MEKIILKEGTEEFNVIKEEWKTKAKTCTVETLSTFIKELTENYTHDYGTICHAMTIASIAAAWAIDRSEQGGITGFQAGAIMWEFIKEWNYSHNKVGLRLIDYDNFLYPQYEHSFEKVITKRTFEVLQREAEILIKNNSIDTTCIEVYKHWQSIVDGVVPFGYTVKD